MTLDKDKLHSGDPEIIAANTYKLVHTLQHMQPHEQLQALALCFTVMVDTLGLRIGQTLEVADIIRRDAHRTNNETILALVEYIKGELK